MNYKTNSETYFYLSKIIFLIFIALFIYVIIINTLNIKLVCDFKRIFGKECVSCGLTRGVYQCVKFNYSSAIMLNKNSVFYFLYAIWHLQLRFTILVIQHKFIKYAEREIQYFILIDLCFILLPIIIYYYI
ncbi:DUF2752 domain-containing protein [Flavobacterium sp. RSSB_23]|uniref:DUF2752 domain-containing protein n=1 Tax=Flavobacterium sp. RSSB_23 TaxID=3447668 RepID=UPI003F3FB52F